MYGHRGIEAKQTFGWKQGAPARERFDGRTCTHGWGRSNPIGLDQTRPGHVLRVQLVNWPCATLDPPARIKLLH